MTKFKSFDVYNVKLSEIADGDFIVNSEFKPVVTSFIKSLISEILLMRQDIEVEFNFNLNMGCLYVGFNKSFPFLQNDQHDFIYKLDGSVSMAEIIDTAVEESAYHKRSLPIDEFNSLFTNIKVFDELFGFDGEFYQHMKKSSFSYTNIGHKDTFKGINIVRMFGSSPGVSLKIDGFNVNVNNTYWHFDIGGFSLQVHKDQFLKSESHNCIKQSVLGFYNLSKGTTYESFDFLK